MRRDSAHSPARPCEAKGSTARSSRCPSSRAARDRGAPRAIAWTDRDRPTCSFPLDEADGSAKDGAEDGDGIRHLGDVVVAPAGGRNNPADPEGAPPAARPRDLAPPRLRPRRRGRAHTDVGAAGALQRGAGVVNLCGASRSCWCCSAPCSPPPRRRSPAVARPRALPRGGRSPERGDAREDRVGSASLPERRIPLRDVRAERVGDPRRDPRGERVRGRRRRPWWA